MDYQKKDIEWITGQPLVTNDFLESSNYLLLHSPGYIPRSPVESEPFQIFNKDDEPVEIGRKKVAFYRGECHGPNRLRGLYHRGVDVLWLKGNNIFIPERSDTKDLYPGCHEFSASEHVKLGESYLAAAIRGLEEELGLDVSPEQLTLFLKTPIKDTEQMQQNAYFLLKHDTDAMRLDKEELKGGAWHSVDDILREGADNLNFRCDHLPAFKKFLRYYKHDRNA